MSKRSTTIDLETISREDIAYFAGLVDGDGCFLISKRTKLNSDGSAQYIHKLQIHCLNEEFIDWIISSVGGVKIKHQKKPPRQNLYAVELTGNRLTQICQLLLPYLRLKKPHAENMLEMRRTYNGTGGRLRVPVTDQAIRNHCFQRSRKLNGRSGNEVEGEKGLSEDLSQISHSDRPKRSVLDIKGQ